MKLRISVGLSTLLTVGACTGDAGSPGGDVVVKDSVGVRIVENAISADPPECAVSGPTLTIGDTSGREEYELYRVFGARRLSDGRIVLVNQGSQELRFYGPDGSHLLSAGREGEGPGEFRDAFYLWVTAGDTIWVGDYGPWQYLVFSPDGEWIRTVRPEPTYLNSPALMAVLDGGYAVLARRDRSSPEDFSTIHQVTPVMHGPDGQVVDTLGTYESGRWGRVGDERRPLVLYPLFEAFTWLDGSGSTWYVGHGSEPEIEVHSSEAGSELVAKVRWTTGDRTVRSSDISAQKEALESRYPDMDPGEVRRFVAPLVSDERPVADRFPVFNEVVANRDGGFWVRSYPRPDGPASHRWLSFDGQGRFICAITLPDVEVVDVGRDYFLVVQETELGVEQVAQFELGEPIR